jgi:membrane-associated phospholipid phosphatase
VASPVAEVTARSRAGTVQAVTRGVVERGDVGQHPAVVPTGRPSWWVLVLAALVAGLVTVDLLAHGFLERVDLWVSEIASDWHLADSAAYPAVWLVTQLGGRGAILVVLAALVAWLAWRRRTWVPLRRVLLALLVLTVAIYAAKYATGRTAPAYPGSYFFADGESYPSGHVANAVLMWGVALWLAVEHGLPAALQRTFRWLSIGAPVATGLAMVALDFHWVTDAVVGGAVGVLLLGVVHTLDARVLSRFVRARAGRPSV